MKKHTLAAVLAVSLFCAVLLGACSREPAPLDTPQTTQSQPTEATEPPFTIDSIRTAELTDVPKYSLYYDLACYMLYYDVMDAPEDTFSPYEMIAPGEAVDAIGRLTGQPVPEIAYEASYLTRQQLAVMLYHTAAFLGCPTQVSGQELAYPDAAQVSADAKEAMLWAAEQGVFRCFLGDSLLPNTAVSRLQLAQSLLALKAFDPADPLASEIYDALPVRTSDSAAKQNHDAIQVAVDAAAKKYGAQGLQVAVIEKGVVTDTYAYGWATRDSDPMTADHKLRIASISKVAVGITAQLLREDGIVDLDADISQYWDVQVKNPKYPDIPITLRGMLTHTSSIINAGDSTSRAYASVKSKLQSSGYSGAVPGDIGYWAYNNYAFAVLGMTLELASNRMVDDILGEKLYAPMDIDAAFGSGDIKNTHLLATLYRNGGEVARSVDAQKNMHSKTTPGESGSFFAGGMTVSVADLGKLIALLAGDGKYEGVQLLSPESVAEMETYIDSAQVPGGSYQALPMRYWPDLYGREGVYFHTGSAYGVFNAATYDPVTGDGVVVLTTGASGAKDDYGIYKVCAEINQYIYDVIK